jgi:signal transduction histidine kinase/PAS domain-containing protein
MKAIAEQFLVRSVLFIALRREGRIVGLISLDNPGMKSSFSSEQQQLALSIGQQAAIAIDNARLYQEAQDERQRAERLIGRAQAIFHVAMAMNSDEELLAVLGIAMKHLVNGMEAGSGAIALLDRDALILASVVNTRIHAPTLSPPLTQLTQCHNAVADMTPRFVLNEDMEGVERRWFQQLGMNNVLIVPLITGSQFRDVFKSKSVQEGRACVGFAFVNYLNNQPPPSKGQLAFAQDITAQCAIAIDKNATLARARQAATLANERATTLDAVFNAMTEGIIVLDMHGEVLVSNNTASQFLGVPLFTKKPLDLFLHAYPTYTLYGQPIAYEDFPLIRALHGEHIRGERLVTRRTDTSERVLELNVAPLLNDENQQIGIVSAFRDVTDQMHVERRMRGALDLILNAIEAISGVTDTSELLRRILTITAHTFHCTHGLVFSHDEEQHVFSPLLALDTCSEQDTDLLKVQELLSQSILDRHEQEPFLSLYNGHATLWATQSEAVSYPIRLQQQKTLLLAPLVHNSHLLGVMVLKQPTWTASTHTQRDFTIWDIAIIEGIGQFAGLAIEQARWQREAESARTSEEALRQANVLKDQFLSITAHEFRTPLTIIQTHSQLVARLLRKAKDVPQRERLLDGLSSIEQQTRQLTNIVETFLEVTRLNKGQVSLNLEPVNLAALVEQTMTDQRTTSKTHTFSYSVEPSSQPYLVLGDKARLSQILMNLLQNAIKYSPHGGPIIVSLRQQENTVEVAVQDKGIGVPKDAQAQLFECFYRAPNAQTSEARGAGLGLYIVAEFLRLHHGAIHVESSGDYGAGSCFIFTLPLLESEPEHP